MKGNYAFILSPILKKTFLPTKNFDILKKMWNLKYASVFPKYIWLKSNKEFGHTGKFDSLQPKISKPNLVVIYNFRIMFKKNPVLKHFSA